MRLVAIHQPNFFPWLGYFDKMARSDVFVFMDAVAFPRRSWATRVRLNIQGNAQWVGCPVRHSEYGGSMLEVKIDNEQPWRRKLLTTLQRNYARAPHFEGTMALLTPMIEAPHTSLVEFNIAVILSIAQALGLAPTTRRQSELQHEGESNELLASLVRTVGGDAYLIGRGAGGYHDPAAFDRAHIRIVEQEFQPFSYGDTKRFIPGLSVIDYLMQDGRPLTREGHISQ